MKRTIILCGDEHCQPHCHYKQAEISFKAGEREADKKWRQILKDSVAMARLVAIKEVIE